MKIIRTKGNVIVNDIKIGDIHFEFEYGCGIKSKVITLPKEDNEGNWHWESINLKTGKKINYIVNPDYPHYSVNLYDYDAYSEIKY